MKHHSFLFKRFALCLSLFLLSSLSWADGINCDKLPQWSDGVIKVNLHHVFCGEINKRNKAVGFHSRPNGDNPTTYISSKMKSPPNAAGIYELENIKLSIKGIEVVKHMSSMFPDHCSRTQVVESIVYASQNNTGKCTAPTNWALCGPSAPKVNNAAYCVGSDASVFIIATSHSAVDEINTGFPIYVK